MFAWRDPTLAHTTLRRAAITNRPVLDLGLEGASVVILGGKDLIESVVVDHFHAAGAQVYSLDIVYPDGGTRSDSSHSAFLSIHCDVLDEVSALQAFAERIRGVWPCG